MKKSLLFFTIIITCATTFAQSPYGKILTLDNTGTQEWIDIGTVLANYISYHPTVRQPAWLPDGNTITGTEFIGTKNNQPLIFRTNNTENMRLTETGLLGIGTTTPAEKLDVAGNVRFSGALMPNGSAGSPGQLLVSQGSNTPPVWSTVSFSENDPVYSSWINATGSTSNQILRFDGTKYFPTSTGNLTTTTTGVTITGGTGAVIGSGTTIDIAIASGTTTGLLSSTDWTTFNNKENALTFNSPLSRAGNSISIPQASGTTDGYLSSTDWTTFNNKLSSTLNSGNIFVGNSSNVATGVALSGDATITNAGVLMVTGLQTRPVSNAAPTDGQVLTWNNTQSRWEPQTPSSDWTLSGNSLTGTERFGSTNDQPVTMITNNTDRFRFTTKGQIEVLNSARSVFLGEGAGTSQNNSSNRDNVFIGYQAGNSNTTGYYNTANGMQAFYDNATGHHNTANGYQALYSNTIGNYNTANGALSLYHNTSGDDNTANGSYALYFNSTGFRNTANGYQALYSNSIGNDNTANGWNSLFCNSTGSNNVAIGYRAGYGATTVNFNQCTFVGANTFPTTSRTNVTMLGYGITNAECTGDNQVLLGNTSVTQIRAQVGSITTYSDARFKTDVKDNVVGLDFIMRLKPVTFKKDPTLLHKIWGTPDSVVSNIDHSEVKSKRYIGFLAQDVEKAMKESGFDFPGIDIPQNEKEVYTLRYEDFIMPLIKAVQEQQNIIEELSNENRELSTENTELKTKVANLESRLQRIESIISGQGNFEKEFGLK